MNKCTALRTKIYSYLVDDEKENKKVCQKKTKTWRL